MYYITVFLASGPISLDPLTKSNMKIILWFLSRLVARQGLQINQCKSPNLTLLVGGRYPYVSIRMGRIKVHIYQISIFY